MALPPLSAPPQTPSRVLLDRRGVVRALSATALVLLFAHLGVLVVEQVSGHDYLGGLGPLFNLDSEKNLPSFFSAILCLLGAALLTLVWRVRWHRAWLVLAATFVFLAFDELFQVHESLIKPLRERLHVSGFLYFAWVLAYGAAVLVIAVAFAATWWRLPRRVRFWFAASAATYVLGAIGFEMIGARHFEALQLSGGGIDLVYRVYTTIEESLEMAGLIMFTHGLLLLFEAERGVAVLIGAKSGLDSGG